MSLSCQLDRLIAAAPPEVRLSFLKRGGNIEFFRPCAWDIPFQSKKLAAYVSAEFHPAAEGSVPAPQLRRSVTLLKVAETLVALFQQLFRG